MMNESSPPAPHRMSDDEPPPFLGTWRNVYIFVACYVIAVIVLLYFFSRAMAA